jgi:hypothetical protein
VYGALWRILPGPGWLKAVECLVLLLLVVWVLFTWVFPAVSPYLPFTDNTVGAAASPGRAPWRA